MTLKKKPGRPRKNKSVTVKVSTVEYLSLKRHAKRLGFSVTGLAQAAVTSFPYAMMRAEE